MTSQVEFGLKLNRFETRVENVFALSQIERHYIMGLHADTD